MHEKVKLKLKGERKHEKEKKGIGIKCENEENKDMNPYKKIVNKMEKSKKIKRIDDK